VPDPFVDKIKFVESVPGFEPKKDEPPQITEPANKNQSRDLEAKYRIIQENYSSDGDSDLGETVTQHTIAKRKREQVKIPNVYFDKT
jgi:hypothetical protein